MPYIDTHQVVENLVAAGIEKKHAEAITAELFTIVCNIVERLK